MEEQPQFRNPPDGEQAFGATQEPEFRTTGPDGRSSDPQRRLPAEDEPYLGPVTQDDVEPQTFGTYPTQEREGDLTFVAVFEDMSGAESCARDLERRALDIEVAFVARRGDGPEQGTRPAPIITGEGYGLSADDQSPPKDPGMGAGVAVGATIGATAGLLAATYIIPPFGVALTAVGPFVSTLAGAGIGSFLGGLSEFATSEQQDGDDASQYAPQVRRGGVIMMVRTHREDADKVRRLLEFWQPLEIRVQ